MKYQNLRSFQKHLSSAAPHHLCRMYFVAISDDFERAQAIDSILAHLGNSASRFSGVDCDLKECIDAMQTRSLFGETVIVFDEVEKLSKDKQLLLCKHLKEPAGYVLFGARSKTQVAPVVEKEGVVLDLLEEKPWDKEKRLAEQMNERAKRAGKRLAPDFASILFERLGIDPALLESEIDPNHGLHKTSVYRI